MKEAGLPAPEYIEDPNTVRLILRNNIDERMPHRNKASGEAKNEALNDALSKDKKVIIAMIHVRPEITQTEIVDASKFSRSKVQRLSPEAYKITSDRNIIRRLGGRKVGHWEIPS